MVSSAVPSGPVVTYVTHGRMLGEEDQVVLLGSGELTVAKAKLLGI